MKKIAIINIIFCILFVTGCGCEKKEELKTTQLKCTSEMNDYGEKNTVEAKFQNEFLIYEKVETIIEFENETLAQRYYDMYKENSDYKTVLDGNSVSTIIEIENDSKDNIFKYDEFRKNLINNGYTCNDI